MPCLSMGATRHFLLLVRSTSTSSWIFGLFVIYILGNFVLNAATITVATCRGFFLPNTFYHRIDSISNGKNDDYVNDYSL